MKKQEMENKIKRFLSLAVAVIMVIGMLPGNVFASETAADSYVAKIGDETYATLADAITAVSGMSGDVTIDIYGKAVVNGIGLNNANLTGLNFKGATTDAEICIDGLAYVDVRYTSYPVTYTDLILSHINGGYGNDGRLQEYFSTYNGGNVTYTNCSFPNGVTAMGSANGTTVTFNNCTFNNTTTKQYSLWVDGNGTKVIVNGGTFCGVRGVKLFAENGAAFSTLSVSGATFSDTITEKAAVVLTRGESVALTGNTYNNTTDTVQVDDAYASEIAGKSVVIEDKEYTVDSENQTLVEKVEAAPVEVSTYEELVAALANGGSIKLTADITTTAAITTSGVTATIDLNGHTLNVRAGDNKFNDATNLTIQNGTINIDGVVVSGNAIFRLDEYEETLVTTVTLNNVNLTGKDYSSAYGIFYIGDSSVLNVNGGEWTLTNDLFSAGGVFKADDAKATLNITDAKMTLHNVRRVVTYANTTIDGSTIAITGDADGVDAEMEHGFNRSPLTVTDSTITMENLVGRGITAEKGAVTISENSTVTITNAQEATIDVRGGQTVTVDSTSNVTVDAEPTITSGTVTGVTVNVPPQGTLTNCYTSGTGYWGECGGNAKESFVFKFYNGDTYMGSTSLNNVGGIIDGDVYVSWSIMLDAESNTDPYWAMEWAVQPTLAMQPTRCEQWVDGVKVAEAAVEPNWSDKIFPVVAAVTDETGKILSYVNGTTGYTLADAVANGGNITLLADVTEDITIADNATIVLDLNGKTLNGYIAPCNPTSLTVKNGSIVNTNGSYSAIEINAGELVLENVNVSSARHGVRIDGAVTATINGGEYKSISTSGTRHAVNVSGAANVTIKAGTFVGPKGTTMDSGSAVCVQAGAKVTIEGGNFSKGKNSTLGVSGTMVVKGGTFDQDPSAYVAEGYAALPDLNGNYVVGEKPTATVNDLGMTTVAAGDYMVYGNGDNTADMPLSFVMQFLADQKAEDMANSPYADWYGDFVITFTGIENGSFTADGCYLAGHYGSFGWVKVPVDGLTIEEGVRYPVMLGVGMGQKYDYICSDVQDFKCALYLTPEILEANPNIQVKLELAIVDNSQGSDAAASALVNNENVYSVTDYTYDAEDFVVKQVYKVSNKAELNAALAAAQEGETILLTADIDYGTDQLKIENAIILDLGGKTLTTRNAYGGMSVKGNPTIKNGTIVHASNTSAIKVWNAAAFEDLVIDVQGKGDANKTIGGIVLQSGTTTHVGSIKNVTIKGDALTNGIETYNCGDAAQNVIGSMENVTIDAKGTGMLISAPVGTATNCSISGDVNGIEIWIKGTYSASLDLVNSTVEGGVFAHDEFSSNPDIVNNGTLKLTADAATTGAGVEDVTLTIARAENVEGVLEDVMDNAQAKVNDTYYLTLAEALAAAQSGDEVTILAAGTYALTGISGKDITITGAVDGVVFDNIGAFNMGGANVTFNNVTFDYYPNVNYTGLQHSGDLVYNNCTINGQVFLYGTSETFNNCTFNQNSSDAYNVWTYGANEVEFNECTFNSAGKSVLIYSESASQFNDVTVTDCDFIASAPVDGKAAIEMDSSLTAGINLTIDGATTATGFGSGNVSGNSLWNNKKGSNTDANNDITVVVDGVTVLAPVKFAAKIGNTGYTTIADAIKAANAGETVTILAGNYTTDIAVNKAITVVGETDANGNNLVNITGGIDITADGATVKNLTASDPATSGYNSTLYINAKNVLVEGCVITDKNALRYSETDGTVTFKNSTITGSVYGIHFDGSAGGNIVIDNCVITGWTSFAGTIEKVTIKDTTFAEGNYNYIRFYQDADISGCTFNEKMAVDVANSVSADVTVTDCTVVNGNVEDLFEGADIVNSTITVDGVELTRAAKIGDTYYETIADAIKAAKAGETVTILAGNYTTDIAVNKAITVVGETDANGNNLVNITGRVTVNTGATVKNLNVHNDATGEYACALNISGKDIVIDGCELSGYNAVKYSYATGKVTFQNSKLTGTEWAIHFDGSAGGDVVVDNCEVNGWIAFGGSLDKVTLKDSKFTSGKYAGGRTYNKNVEITGCEFEAGYKFDLATAGADVTVTNTTVGGESAVKLFNSNDLCGQNEVVIDGNSVAYVAAIGSTYYATLEEALADVADWTTIKLVANATLDYNAREAYGRTTTEAIIIDGQGYTLTLNQKDSDWSSIGMASAEGKLTLKNMTIEKTGYGDTTGAWNTHSIIFSCNVEMNNVTVNNAVAVQNGATLNNVTINEANGYYGLWINGNGQTVTVNGGAINATNGGRGIKIADEYVDSPASVTLSVTDTKFNTAKKAAVLVSSTAGANITASNVDITNVAADSVNFVWVDEDWAANYGNVEVTGATKAQENVETFNIVVKDGDKIVSYFKTLDELFDNVSAYAKVSNVTVELMGDVVATKVVKTSSLKTYNFVTNVADGVTMDLQYADNWNYFRKVNVGEGVTVKAKYLVFSTEATIAGTVDCYYPYINGGKVTVAETGVLKYEGGDALQVKGNGAVLTVNGTVIAPTINVWVGNAQLIVSGTNAKVQSNWIDIWDGAPTVKIENGATIETKAIKVSRGGEITVTDATLTAETIEVGHNGNSAGVLTETGNSTINGQIKMTATGSVVNSDGGLNVTTNIADHKVVYENGQYKVVPMVYVAQIGDVKYESIQAAVDAAEDGATITVIADHEMVWDGALNVDDIPCLVIVKDKSITLDLNGKAITANMTGMNAKYNIGIAVTGTGALTINATNGGSIKASGIKAYSLFSAYDSTAKLTINGGTYELAEAMDCLIHSAGDETVTVNGGTFTLGNVGTGTNGQPWIFNANGANVRNVTVNGGTFNSDVNHQFWQGEVLVPETLALQANGDGTWTVVPAVAYVVERATCTNGYDKNIGYATLAEALTAASNGSTITLLWAEGNAPIAMNGAVFGKSVTITGTATVDWSKGFLFVGRGGAGNGTVIFDNANLTSASNSASYGIHVSGREKDTTNKYDGTLIIKNSTIELDYLINKGTMTLDNATLTVKNGFSIGGRPASETESGEDATATLDLTNGSKVVVNNHNGMGLGYEAIGVMNIDATSSFETTQSFLVTAKCTMNIAGTVKIAGTLTNNGSIVLTDAAATLTSSECGNVTTNVDGYVVEYTNGIYKLTEAVKVAEVNGVQYKTLAEAIAAANSGDTVTLLANITEDVTVSKSLTIDGANFKYTGNISVSGTSSAVTVKKVNFVDGTGYAITTNRIKSITVEDCTVTNYAWGFLYANKSTPTVVVKNVTVTGGTYGMHWVYGTTATLENVTMTNVTNGLLIQNYASKTINLKNCSISSITIWERSGYSGVQTFNFEGANTVGTLSSSDYAKYVLTATDATLTAPEGATVTTTVDGYEVKHENGTYKLVEKVVLFDLYGANMDLGNKLDMNFYFLKSNITDSGSYAVISKQYADGSTVSHTINAADFVNQSKDLYKISFQGIAAKEMADTITVTLYNSNGVQISNVWTDSVRAYCMRMFDKASTDVQKTLYVDMLNYGAAAQKYFKYNESDYANSQLTAEQQAYATKLENLENNSNFDSTYYYGANMDLESSIKFNMYFLRSKVTPDMQLDISYTDHNGNVHNIHIDGADFVVQSKDLYKVTIDELVVADVEQLITCVIKDADGNEITTVVESIESYLARRSSSNELYESIMKFGLSAHAYLHRNDK